MGCCKGGSQAGFPPVAPCIAPVPTIPCEGLASSYVYDDFSRDRGWWLLSTSPSVWEVAAGMLRSATSSGNNANSRLLPWTPTPVGVGVVTLVAHVSGSVPAVNKTTNQVAIRLGNSKWVVFGGFSGGLATSVYFYIATNVSGTVGVVYTGPAISHAVPYVLPSTEIKIVADVVDTKYYIGGVLVYTGTPIVLTDVLCVSVEVTKYIHLGTSYYLGIDDLVLFGENLPVDC